MKNPDATAWRRRARAFRLSLMALAIAPIFFAPAAWADTIEGPDNTSAIGIGACNPNPGSAPPDQIQNTEYGIGAGCNTTGRHNVGIGFNAGSNVIGILNVAVGDKAGSHVTGQSNSAFGDFAGAYVTGDNNTAVGSYAGYLGDGQGTTADDTTAVGARSLATAKGGTVLGSNATASGIRALAAGMQASAGGDGSVALGDRASTTASGAIAIGRQAQATGLQSIAVGVGNQVGGAHSGAFGDPNTVTGAGSYAFGNDNTVNADNAFVLGNNVTIAAGLNGAVALGNNSTVGAATPTAGATIGGSAYTFAGGAPTAVVSVGSAGNERQIQNVAAGRLSASSTDAVNGSQLYATHQQVDTNTGDIANNSTSITDLSNNALLWNPALNAYDASHGGGGPQRISNVAGGQLSATSTDAVNGSQLYATNQQVDINTGDIATNATNITNLTTQVNQPITFTGNDVSAGTASVKLGGSLAIMGGATAAGTYSDANVKTVTDAATGAVTIQLADSPKFGNVTINDGGTGVISGVSDGVDGDDAVNKSQLDDVAAAVGKGWNISAQGANASNVAPDGTVDLNNGDGNIEVSKTAGSNDVTFDLADDITVNSMTVGNSVLDTNGLTVDDGTHNTTYGATGLVITGGPQVTIDGIDAGNLKITNVAPGTLSATSTDAVNGSQLYATNQAVTNLGDQVTNIGNGSVGMFQVSQDHNAPAPSPTGQDSAAGGAGAAASGDSSLAVGNASTASGNNSTALGNGATASGVGSTAVGQGAEASADGSVALGSGASDGGRGAESYTGKYSGATNDTVGTVSVGNAANGETRTISNVADAKEATDAVNLRQLDGAVQAANDYTDQQVTQINSSVTNLENGSAGMFQVSPDANGTAPKPTGTESIAGGNNAVASGNHSTALGDNTVASADNSVALGHGSVADRANSVSMGSKGHERQVTHVAAGTDATDAVNVSQLEASQAGSVQYVHNKDGSVDYSQVTLNPGGDSAVIHNVGPGKSATDAVNVAQLENGVHEAENWAKDYTDSRFQSVNHDLNVIGNRANAGIASAMAMASLPQAYRPNQSAAAVALGSFHGEASIAIGLSTVTDSGRFVLKLNASTNTRGDAGVGVGAAIVW